MASPSLPEMTNWHKCSRLLIEGGLSILKEFLKNSYSPGSLDQFLASKKRELTDLRNKHILNASQWVKLFPRADIKDLDITLVTCIISNLIIQPSSSQKTALDGIRLLRNKLFAHADHLSMDTIEFVKNWKLIDSALKKAQEEFGTNIPLQDFIDTIEKEEAVNLDELREALETWKHNDDNILQEIQKTFKEISELKGEVKEHSSGISELKGEVKEHSLGMSELKGEVKEHSSGISELKGEVKDHSSEILELKGEVKEHSLGNLELKGEVNEMKATRNQIQSIRSEESKLPEEILRKDKQAIHIYKKALSDGKHAVQNIRVMLVGQSGVGKTTLLKRLLDEDVDIKKIESTEGIEVHVHRCKIDVNSGQWHCQDVTPPHPNAALLSVIMPMFTETPMESIPQHVQDTSPMSDTSPFTDDEVIYRRQQNVTGVDVTIASEPEADVHASTVRPKSTSSKSDDTKVEKHLKELIETSENSENLSDSNFANVSFWDFAGQYIFYNTHQVFLSHRTVYLLVTKLKHIVDEAGLQRQDCDTKLYDTIEFWVDSIHFFCGKENHNPRVPPVILVATHADEVEQAKKEILIHNHFQKVRDIFANKVTAGHIVDDLEFAVDNSVQDPQLEELKTAILNVARTQYYWQEEHPVRWLTLEKVLFDKRKSGEKVLQLKAVKDINENLPFHLRDEELDLFLQFQSDLGNILYISEGELKDYVLLNPQWVADAFKCIITAEQFLNRKMELREHWKQAKTTGKISKEIIEKVWRDKKSEGFFQEREFLLLLMQQLNLIARPIGTEQPDSHFFVPCLITERPSCPPIPFKGEATSVLTMSAASRFFPMILFYKLIASCITEYKIYNDHIYNCSALFEHKLHVFTVLYFDNTVKVWVNSLDEDNPDITVCQRVLKFLIECMNKLQLSCIKTSSVAVFACCPEVAKNSVQGMHQLPGDIDQWQALSKEKFVCSNRKCAPHSVSMRDALKYWIPGSKKAAGQTYKKALAKAWVRLIEEMNFDELLDRIIEKELFSQTAIQDLRDERNTSYRNRAILKKISTSGPEKYEVFKECLALIEQSHLAKLLEKYETGTCSNPEAMARRPTQQEPDKIPRKN